MERGLARIGKISKPHYAGLLLAGSLAVAASAQGPNRQLAMLDHIDDGQWELRLRGGQGRPEHICIRDGRQLIQLRHKELPCDHTVIEDSAESVTVQYTCRGKGYGRTHIRRETDRLIQLDAQGIAGGIPFDFAVEGRRIGDCVS